MNTKEFIEKLEKLIKESKQPVILEQNQNKIAIVITEKGEKKAMEETDLIPIKTSEIKEILEKYPENPQEMLKELIEFKKFIKDEILKKFKGSQIKSFKIN